MCWVNLKHDPHRVNLKVKSHNSSATTGQAVHRTLRQVIDLIEGDEGFEGTVDDDGDSDMAEK